MFQPKTFVELCMAMQSRAIVSFKGLVGRINAIEAEDGSGRSWNVRMQTTEIVPGSTDGTQTVYFREG